MGRMQKLTDNVSLQRKKKPAKPLHALLSELAQEAEPLERDPAFLADCLKGQFVEDILRLMEQAGVSRNELAQRMGKSRQYLSRVLNEKANFTIESMAEIACALGAALSIRMDARQKAGS